MRWIRVNIDFDDSPWLFVLSAESQLAWLKLLCHVKRDGSRGECKALSTIVAAKKWGVGEESVAKLLQAAVSDGAMSLEDGLWRVTSWARFQEPDQTNAERQRRHRERQKEASQVQNVTESNAVTGRDKGVTCHATETETKTEVSSNRELGGVGGTKPLAPGPAPDSDPDSVPWWDLPDCDPLAAYVATGIRKARRYECDRPGEAAVLRLIAKARESAPHDDDIRSVVDKFVDDVAIHDARRYVNPAAELGRWCDRRRTEWIRLKAELARSKPPDTTKTDPAQLEERVVAGRLRWFIGDRQLTAAEAAAHCERHGKRVPELLERAVEKERAETGGIHEKRSA